MLTIVIIIIATIPDLSFMSIIYQAKAFSTILSKINPFNLVSSMNFNVSVLLLAILLYYVTDFKAALDNDIRYMTKVSEAGNSWWSAVRNLHFDM